MPLRGGQDTSSPQEIRHTGGCVTGPRRLRAKTRLIIKHVPLCVVGCAAAEHVCTAHDVLAVQSPALRWRRRPETRGGHQCRYHAATCGCA